MVSDEFGREREHLAEVGSVRSGRREDLRT